MGGDPLRDADDRPRRELRSASIVATQSGSRDGMPAVARLRDGSLVPVFASFRAPRVPRFVVRSVQSNDGSRTSGRRQNVYVPANAARNAGAPFVVTLPDGRLAVSFMTDGDAATVAWPAHATMKVLISDGVPTHGSLRWRATPLVIDGPEAYWPALFVTPGSGDLLAIYHRRGIRARRVRIRR